MIQLLAKEEPRKPLRYRIALIITVVGWLYGLGAVLYNDSPTWDKFMLGALVVGSALVWYMDQQND